MIKLLKDLFVKTFPIIPAGLLLKGLAIIDQLFAAELGSKLLNSHSFIIYIPFIIAPIGRALGMPLLVVLGKEQDESKRLEFVKSGTLLCTIVSFILFILILLASNWFFGVTKIYTSTGVYYYYILQGLSSVLLLLASYFNFVLLAHQKANILLKSYILTFTLNIIGNSIGLWLFDGEEALTAFGVATLFSTVSQLIYQHHAIGNIYLKQKLKASPFAYLERAKKLVPAQFIISFAESSFPFIVGLYIQRNLTVEFATVFNLTGQIIQFLYIPLVSLITAGTSWYLAKIQEVSLKNELVSSTLFSLICVYTFVPVVIFWCLPENIYELVTGVPGGDFILYSKLLLFSVVNYGVFLLPAILINVKEETYINTVVSLLGITVTLVLLYMTSFELTPIRLIGILIIPRAVICILVYAYKNVMYPISRGIQFGVVLAVFCSFSVMGKEVMYSQLKELKVGYIGEPIELNPFEIKSMEQILLNSTVFDTIVTTNSRNMFRAKIAKSWKIKNNSKKYILQIDEGKYFYEGRKIFCLDVARSLIYHKKNKQNKTIRNIDKIYCKGSHLHIDLKKSDLLFLKLLSSIEYSVFLRENDRIHGAGKYEVIKADSGNFSLKLKSSHVGSNKLPQKISFIRYDSNIKAAKAFKSNKVDYIPRIKYSNIMTGIEHNILEASLYNRIHLLVFGKKYLKQRFNSFRRCIAYNIANFVELKPIGDIVLYQKAFGVTPPGYLGHQQLGPVAASRVDCKDLEKTDFEIATLTNRYLKKNLNSVLEGLSDFKVIHRELGLDEFIKASSEGSVDAFLFSFGIGETSVENFNEFYTSNTIFMNSNYIPKLEDNNLSTISNRSELQSRIFELQEQANAMANIIPIAFEKSLSLIDSCLKMSNQDKSRVDHFANINIMRLANCED